MATTSSIAPPQAQERPAPPVPASRRLKTSLSVYIIVFLTGAVVLSLEITGPRLLSTTYGSTTILWAIVISVTLGGLSAGYYLAALVPPRSAPFVIQCLFMLAAVAVASVKPLIALLAGWLPTSSVPSLVTVASISLLAPFVFLGAIPVLLLDSLHGSSGTALPSQCAGRAYAVSTLGSIVGALASAFLGIPYLGLNLSLALLATILVLIAAFYRRSLLPLGLLCVAVLPTRTFLAWERQPGVIASRQSAYQGIRILRHPRTGNLSLWLDAGLSAVLDPETGEPLGPFAHEAVALADRAGVRTALILGGAGNTIALALEKRGIETQTVEIDPDVAELSDEYFGAPRGPTHIQDARAFLRGTRESFDCIILDAFSGPFVIPPHLLSQEFFRAVDDHLTPGGFLLMNYFGALEGPYGRPLELLSSTMGSVLGEASAIRLSTFDTPEAVICSMLIATGRARDLRDDYVSLPEPGEDVVTDDRNPMDLLMLEASHVYYQSHPLIGPE